MKLIKPKHFHVLILDEVDAMVTEGHASILDRLVKPLTKDDSVGKIICASATVSSNAEVFFAEKLPRLQTGRVAFTTAKVKHYWLYTSSNRRDITLCRTIREARVKKGIIFIKDASKTAHVYHTLTEDGYKCDSMQAVATRQQRRGALDKFRAGEIDYLITTDLLARGMDVPGCDVIHYDMPRTIESFIHRAGRAGRGLSEDGRNFIITSSRDSYMLRKFRDACHIDIEELPLARGMRSKSQQGGFSRPKQQEGGKKIKDMKGYKGKKPSDEKEDKKSFRRPERGAARPARGEKKSEGGKPKENRRAPRGEGRAPRDTPKDSTAGGDGNRAPKKRN